MIRLALRVRREDAEVALAELLPLAPSGVEEVDLGDRVEYAIYGPPGELPALPDLEAAAGDALVEIVTTEVADDWQDRWKQFHQPVELPGPPALRVRPPWEPAAPDATSDASAGGTLEIVIDPGQAFGTGGHHTTRLCLELLLELEPAGAFMDLGCGSGVLAIAAAKLGWGPVAGVDFDPLAVDATADNARVNGVEVEVGRVDVKQQAAPSAPTVAANLLRPLLLALEFAPGTEPQRLIASGLLTTEADEIAAHFADRYALRETRRVSGGEWSALLLERAAG